MEPWGQTLQLRQGRGWIALVGSDPVRIPYANTIACAVLRRHRRVPTSRGWRPPRKDPLLRRRPGGEGRQSSSAMQPLSRPRSTWRSRTRFRRAIPSRSAAPPTRSRLPGPSIGRRLSSIARKQAVGGAGARADGSHPSSLRGACPHTCARRWHAMGRCRAACRAACPDRHPARGLRTAPARLEQAFLFLPTDALLRYGTRCKR